MTRTTEKDTLEVHILDFEGENLYKSTLRLRWVQWIRGGQIPLRSKNFYLRIEGGS